MDESKVQFLLDRMEISDTVIRYATGIDIRNWEMYRSCFTDEVEVDFSSWMGDSPMTVSAEKWADIVRKTVSGFESTQHISANHVISLNGDQATCVSYLQAQHFLPNDKGDNALTLGGYYTNELVRTGGGWKIRKCKLKVTWATGNQYVFKLAREKISMQDANSDKG